MISASGTVTANGAISAIEDVTLGAASDVVAGEITAQFGTVALVSTESSVRVNGTLYGGLGVEILARQNLSTGNVGSYEGAVVLKSEQSTVTMGNVVTEGGDIYISAFSNVVLQNLISQGGAITIVSRQGTVTTGYLRSDGYGTGGKIYLQAYGYIRVINSVNIGDTEYSIYTGIKKKGEIRVVPQSSVLKLKNKAKFIIGDASLNGTLAGVSGGSELISFRQRIPVTPQDVIRTIIQEIIKSILDGGQLAPPHVDEINPITNKPYSGIQEFELIKKLTVPQKGTLKKIINSKDPKFAPHVPEDLLSKGKVDEKKGCFLAEMKGHLGDDPENRLYTKAREYATFVSGSPNDFLVIDKEGLDAYYDGKVNPGGTGYAKIKYLLGTAPYPLDTVVVVEAKYEYMWLNKFIKPVLPPRVPRLPNLSYDPIPPQQRQINIYTRMVGEINKEAKVAHHCGLLFFVSFNRYQAYASGVELFSYTQTRVTEHFAHVVRVPAPGQKTP